MSVLACGSAVHPELSHRLGTLRSDFTALGTRAASAAQALAATVPPPAELLDELTAAQAAFTGLRAAVVERAGSLGIVLDAAALATLGDLEPALVAIAAAEAQRVRLAAWEAARTEALGVLERVATLGHRDDRALPALLECQDHARQVHAALTGPAPEALEQETQRLPETVRPWADLLALVEGWNTLDDERCAALQDTITEAFGRGLALAALRGKLGRPGTTPPAVTAARSRPRSPARPREPVASVPELPVPETEQTPPRVEPPPRVTPPAPIVPASPVAAPPVPRPVPASAEPVVAEVTGARLEPPSLDEETAVQAPPSAGSEQEAELEHLAQQSAPWWIMARAGWQGLRERGLSFGDAAHDYLTRFPYLLSVPLQRTSEYEGGRLAEGYALLLSHIDKQEQGFVKEALTRLNPRLAGRGQEPYPLAQELYLYIVAEGRLYKTYPDFVREVVAHAVPRPGAWVQGGIVESDDETRLFMRAETPGGSEEQTRTLTDPGERSGPHLFRVTLGPLTTRFFTVRAAADALADPPNVDIKLKENEAPTDHAWLTILPAGGKAPGAPRKHRTGGSNLEELGGQFGGFWMAVFNADPRHDRHYELSVALRRKPAPVSASSAPPAADRFFGKRS
jgi:hypothetical protein